MGGATMPSSSIFQRQGGRGEESTKMNIYRGTLMVKVTLKLFVKVIRFKQTSQTIFHVS